MPRVLALGCSACGRKFGGDETKRKHRVIAGDRFKCRSDVELQALGWYRDGHGVWHRPGPSARLRPTLFDVAGPGLEDTNPEHLARASDPITSKVAARAIAYRTGSHKALLFAAYLSEPAGLTDEEAAARVGMQLYEATKRCADLRNDGAIVSVGVRKGRSGLERQVCKVAEQVAS